MSNFASESLRMLRRIIRGREAPAPHAGRPRVLDGVSAIAALEARICDVAGLGASYPAALAARVWNSHETDLKLNALNAPITGIDADSPRTSLAAAMGVAMSGRRATVFLSGPDLVQSRDLLAEAAGRRLPLVIHAVLRAGASHAQALGTGHEAYHALDGLALLRYCATNVQEAVDLALIARRASELALVPAIVAMDPEQTALALQSVAVPDNELLRAFLGSPNDILSPATPAQRILFGESRRRIPALYDLERPAALGTLQGTEAWALGAVAGRAFFDHDIEPILTETAEAYAAQTARRHEPIRTHRTDDASIVLVAQGSMVEIAESVADWARANEQRKVGVIGIRRMWPLDGAALAEALKGTEVACVLERVACSAQDDGPLMRQVRAVLDRCRENAQHGSDTHTNLPALSQNATPRLIGASAGLGGLPVNAADLLLLVRELASPKPSFHYVGLDLLRSTSKFPKHQALMDAIRRDFPDAAALGLCDHDTKTAPTLQEFTTLAVLRSAGRTHEPFIAQLASLAHSFLGGSVRSRPGISWQRFEQTLTDRVSFSTSTMVDAGDDVALDIAVLADAGTSLPTALRDDAALVTLACHAETAATHAAVRTIWAVPTDTDNTAEQREALLGGSLRVLLENAASELPSISQVSAKRAEMLTDTTTEPDRDALLAAFTAGFEHVQTHEAAAQHPKPRATADATLPREVADMPRGEGVSSLARFWDHAGVFYNTNTTEELIAEPGMATGATPAFSSVFRKAGRANATLPIFVPAECTGSPDLWSTCPDGSVAPLAITPRALLQAGIDLATRAGAEADALRPALGQLAKRSTKLALAGEPPTTAGALFADAFEAVIKKMQPPEDRAAALRGAFDAVLMQIGILPIAVTDAFFREPERSSPGSGAFLSLAINPDACKCPELIASRCNGRGITLTERTPDSIEQARRVWALWQTLPDTAGDIIERTRNDERIGALGAMMLSRYCLHAMAPGDGAEAGSGAKLALRQVLAIAEFHYQPRTQRLVGLIKSLRTRLSDRIQQQLATALPTGDLEALATGLETLGRGDVELSALSSKIDSAIVDGNVDGELLGRLVDAARGLADLEWKLTRGAMGLGRARVGLVLAAGSVPGWASAFPYNPFIFPVAVDASNESGGLARGIFEGYLREVIDGFRLMRLAKIEIERPAEAPHAAARMAGMTYADLTTDERELVPPILLIGDGHSLGGRGLSQLVWLFESGLPIKAIVLNDIGSTADGALSLDAMGAYPPAQRTDLSLLAMLTRKAFVTQGSIAHPNHFAESVERALATQSPALINLHAPSPERHGFDTTQLFDQAALAVESRAWPLLSFDPLKPGVFGSCMDISANPLPTEQWTNTEEGTPITPIDWALTEARFADQLRPMPRTIEGPVPLLQYLDLDADTRANRSPFIEVKRHGEKIKLAVDGALASDAVDRARLWRTLQELAGEVTPFTDKVRADIEQSVADTHKAEVAAVKADYETRLASLRAEIAAETTANVTDRLMTLAGYTGGRA